MRAVAKNLAEGIDATQRCDVAVDVNNTRLSSISHKPRVALNKRLSIKPWNDSVEKSGLLISCSSTFKLFGSQLPTTKHVRPTGVAYLSDPNRLAKHVMDASDVVPEVGSICSRVVPVNGNEVYLASSASSQELVEPGKLLIFVRTCWGTEGGFGREWHHVFLVGGRCGLGSHASLVWAEIWLVECKEVARASRERQICVLCPLDLINVIVKGRFCMVLTIVVCDGASPHNIGTYSMVSGNGPCAGFGIEYQLYAQLILLAVLLKFRIYLMLLKGSPRLLALTRGPRGMRVRNKMLSESIVTVVAVKGVLWLSNCVSAEN